MVVKISDISSLPQVDEAINGWEVSITANQKQQTMVDGDVVYTDVYVKMKGVLQPLRADELELKDESQRTWRWYWLHVKTNYPLLEVNQQFFVKSKAYKVMQIKPYNLNGFMEYQAIEDYQQDE